MFDARTDLVIESKEFLFETGLAAAEIAGVQSSTESYDFGICVTHVTISDIKGEVILKKPQGEYITIELPEKGQVRQEAYEEACRVCSSELSKLLDGKNTETILVVGLGNRNITADSVGPKSIDTVLVTRHLLQYMPDEIDSRLKSVCAVSPGVLGITGVETGEIVRGLVDRIKPTLVIAIDALCARHIERVNSTIQMSDTGITPGAGIGNRRMALDEETLGIPVIAIGVPTVIDAATIVGDTVDLLVDSMKQSCETDSPLFKILETLESEDPYPIIKQLLSPQHGDFIVTPKEKRIFL